MHRLLSKIKKQLYFVVAGYFRFWANVSLRRWKPTIIAVTGSVGKTTMLHLLELTLGERAHYSHNANSAFGIPFDIVGTHGIYGSKARWFKLFLIVPWRALTFTHSQQYYVVEIDGERPNEATFLANWLRPHITLWVSSARSHAIFFDRQVREGRFSTVEEAIAYEFASLARAARDLVVIDGDNEHMVRETANISAKVAAVHKSDLTGYTVTPQQAVFTFGETSFTIPYPMPREISTQLAMLLQLTNYLNVPLPQHMNDFVMPPSRSSYFAGVGDQGQLHLVDSTYNAHLVSMQSMFTMMQEMTVPGEKWLVIGDMTDQGEGERDQHEKLGQAAAQVAADRYVLVGRRTKKYTLPQLEKAGKGDKTAAFTKTEDALQYICKQAPDQATIMLKGSQYLEWIVEKLLADKANITKLARQDAAAKRRRAKWGLY